MSPTHKTDALSPPTHDYSTIPTHPKCQPVSPQPLCVHTHYLGTSPSRKCCLGTAHPNWWLSHTWGRNPFHLAAAPNSIRRSKRQPHTSPAELLVFPQTYSSPSAPPPVNVTPDLLEALATHLQMFLIPQGPKLLLACQGGTQHSAANLGWGA